MWILLQYLPWAWTGYEYCVIKVHMYRYEPNDFQERLIEPALDRFVNAGTPEAKAAARQELGKLFQTFAVSLIETLNARLGPDEQVTISRKNNFAECLDVALDTISRNTLQIVSAGRSFVRASGGQRPVELENPEGHDQMSRSVEKSDRLGLVVEVLREMGVDISELPAARAEVIPRLVWRQTPYVLVCVPSLDISILVCDERGNRTFVAYSADEAVLEEILDEDGIDKDVLDSDERVASIEWRGTRDFLKERLRFFLELDEAPQCEEEETFIGGADGVAKVIDPATGEEREVIHIKPYARSKSHYSIDMLLARIKEAGLQKTGLRVRFPGVRRALGPSVYTYWKDEVDAIMPVFVDRNGIGSMPDGENGEREIISPLPYLEFRAIPRFNPKNLKTLLAAANVELIEGRSGKMVKSPRATEIYWKDEVDDALNRIDELLKIYHIDERGVVDIDGREAVVRIPYSKHLGMGHRRFGRILAKRGVKAVSTKELGCSVRSGDLGRGVKEVLWKDAVDAAMVAEGV